MEYEQLKKLIPKDKHDFEPFTELTTLSNEEIKSILPDLIKCIIDPNWPIAKSVVDILILFPDSVIPLIKEILNSNDPATNECGIKHSIIYDLVPRFPVHLQKRYLLKDILRIFTSPTEEEVSEGVWGRAKIFLENYYGKNVLEKLR